ncbi:uncharacterized protein LOC115661535 [Syzygium oleosum]|uniref:uncharacterized protein LOC115661535 n=1 Tax=Syzygium oleosum TaxID=219896 RepID=UPI0011D2A261|nr:uncharacterized protein LOC115661535 [Syzygium oleosum]
MTSLETSLAQSGLQQAPAAPEPSGAEHEPEPKESQVGYDPMDVDLEAIPEEEPEEKEPKSDPEEPEDEPEEEPEHIPEYEQWIDLEFVPEDEFDEEPVEEEWDEVPAESGDINNPIEIEAEPEYSESSQFRGIQIQMMRS